MAKVALLFILGAIFLIIALLGAVRSESKEYTRTEAVIERVIFSDTGNVKYYVSFVNNGVEILAQTDHYSSETKSLNPGDKVEIGYYLTKNGKFRAVVLDDGLEPVSSRVGWLFKLMLVCGCAMVSIAIVLFVRSWF